MSLHITKITTKVIMRSSFINICKDSVYPLIITVLIKKIDLRNKKKYTTTTFYREKDKYHAQVIFHDK